MHSARTVVLLALLAVAGHSQTSETLLADLDTGPATPNSGVGQVLGTALDRLWIRGGSTFTSQHLFSVATLGAAPVALDLPKLGIDGSGVASILAIQDLGTGRALVFVTYPFAKEVVVLSTDGSSAGTFPLGVHAISGSGATYSKSDVPVVIGGKAYFAGTTAATGVALYETDGSIGGTQLLDEIFAGPAGDGLSTVYTTNGKLVYNSRTANSDTLRAYDLASGTTSILLSSAIDQLHFRPLGDSNRIVFSWVDATIGLEPFVTDGTQTNTFPLSDINTGTSDSGPDWIASAGGITYFSAYAPTTGRELYRTDGTSNGTLLVADIIPGPANGMTGTPTIGGAMLGSQLVFSAKNATVGIEPHISDGTAAGTRLLADLEPGPNDSRPYDFAQAGPKVIFTASTSSFGSEPYTTDGIGASLSNDIQAGPTSSSPFDYSFFDGAAYFSAYRSDVGRELFALPTGAVQPTLQADLGETADNADSNVVQFVRAGDRAYFTATVGDSNRLYVTTGQSAETTELLSADFDLDLIGALDSGVVFASSIPGLGCEPWFSDGTVEGTIALGDLLPGSLGSLFVSKPQDTQLGRYFYFLAGSFQDPKLWRTDGTVAGTVEAADLGSASGSGAGMFRAGEALVFLEPKTIGPLDFEIWRSDGTTAGTAPLAPTVLSSRNIQFVRKAGERVAFVASVLNPLSYEVWTTGGTDADTRLEASSSLFTDFAFAGERILYTDAEDSLELRLLAVEAGGPPTTVLGPIPFSSGGIQFGAQTSTGVYLRVGEGPGVESGTWFSDGTVAGTRRVFEQRVPTVAIGSDDRALLSIDTPNNGREVWISDGTAAGTALFEDIVDGPKNSDPQGLGRVRDRFLFTAQTPDNGREPHYIELAEAGSYAAEAFGQGCGVASFPTLRLDGEARPGEVVRMETASTAPFAPVVLYASIDATALDVGACGVYLATPTSVGVTMANLAGNASLTYTLVNDPALAGVSLYLQAAAVTFGGPVLGLLELTDGLEVVFGP